MNEIQELLERQARWQKTRQALSWPEKIRMAESVRESVLLLRRPHEAQPNNQKREEPGTPDVDRTKG